MISTRFQSAAVALLFIALTVFMTWPQAGHLGSWVYDNDELFARARGVRDMTAALLARPDIEAVAQIEEPRGPTPCSGCGGRRPTSEQPKFRPGGTFRS